MKIGEIMEEVFQEFMRATNKFGSFHNSHEGFAVLLEEVDELWDCVKANCDKSILQEEAVQVAAMAVRFVFDVCCENTISNQCELCGFQSRELQEYNGRNLCEQCHLGEVENPEHALPPQEGE